MVCSLGRGRMAAMARLLETGNFSEITAEEASPEKLAAQSIYRELREADEENLLEEEDMHVFDCEPMADPLHLVCCNACKKPVKASQYVAHAERCRSLNITEETACGVTKNMGSCQEAQSCGEISKGSIAGRENPCDSVVGCLKPRQTFEHRMSTKVHTKSDAPAPLATKVYHSQRNNRLRSALSYLYHEASKNSCFSLSPKLVQGSVMLPSPKNSLHEQTNDLPQKKKDSYALHAVRKPDQILSQSSELCLGNSGGHLPVMNFPNQFWDISFSRPALSVDASPMGMMSGRYHPTPNSFPGNSGKSLGTMQQPNGSVPVV